MSDLMCPCGKPANVRTWESDLHLCFFHGRDWLTSQEKELAGLAIVEKHDDALRAAVAAFIERIAKKPSFTARVRGAVSALLGRTG